MANCTLCPRNCGVDRRLHSGYCGQTETIRIARAALHFWEEPCISGTRGSGTVFFSGCPLRCVFCQNRDIALGENGIAITKDRLTEIFLELQEQGANNINLVTPTHYVPQIAEALKEAKKKGLHIPIVYNTGSYETVDTIRLLDGLVDIYLPDLKYYSGELSKRYSHAEDYFLRASEAIEEMVRQVGEAEFAREESLGGSEACDNRKCDSESSESTERVQDRKCESESQEDDENDEPVLLMKKGVIVRHLVLPDHTEDSKEVIRYLYETYGDRIFISIMNQYTPLDQLDRDMYPELGRKLTEEEYDEVVDYAIEIGVENGFIQEGETAEESFIPPFDHTGVYRDDELQKR